jgi:hypothetical protein
MGGRRGDLNHRWHRFHRAGRGLGKRVGVGAYFGEMQLANGELNAERRTLIAER